MDFCKYRRRNTDKRAFVQSYLAPLKHHKIQLFGYHLSLPVITGAVLFSLMHLALLEMEADTYMVIVILLMALTLGLMAGYHREKTGSLAPAVIIHSCFNIGSSLLMFFL